MQPATAIAELNCDAPFWQCTGRKRWLKFGRSLKGCHGIVSAKEMAEAVNTTSDKEATEPRAKPKVEKEVKDRVAWLERFWRLTPGTRPTLENIWVHLD